MFRVASAKSAGKGESDGRTRSERGRREWRTEKNQCRKRLDPVLCIPPEAPTSVIPIRHIALGQRRRRKRTRRAIQESSRVGMISYICAWRTLSFMRAGPEQCTRVHLGPVSSSLVLGWATRSRRAERVQVEFCRSSTCV